MLTHYLFYLATIVVLMQQTEVRTATAPRTPGRIARLMRCARGAICRPSTICPYNNRFYLDLTRFRGAPITAVKVERLVQYRGVSLHVSVDDKYFFKGVDPTYGDHEVNARIRREIQFTEALQGIHGVPMMYRMSTIDPQAFPYLCGQTTLVTEFAGDFQVDLDGPGAVQAGTLSLRHLMLTASGILENIHGRGIVHGDIHSANFVLTSPGDMGGLRLIDLERARRYTRGHGDDGAEHPTRADPSPAVVYSARLLSPWELEGSKRISPRDDLFRLAEMGLELAGFGPYVADWRDERFPEECRIESQLPDAILACCLVVANDKRTRITQITGRISPEVRREFTWLFGIYQRSLALEESAPIDYYQWYWGYSREL